MTSSNDFGADEDTLKTTNALKGLGHINDNMPDLDSGLKSFQADNGLKVDGIMNPGGPTENALSQTLAQNGIGNSNLLAKSDTPDQPSNIKITKPISSKPDAQSFTASASFDPPTPSAKSKLDPLTGQPDPLVNSPIQKKSKAEMDKLWEQARELNNPKTAVMPTGDTVDERIRSIMADPRYLKKKEQPIVDHVVRQFERAYPGETQYDETGKMIQPKAVIQPEEVEPFDPDGELNNDPGQMHYVSTQPNELSQHDQASTPEIKQTGHYNYPQSDAQKSIAIKPSDELGSEIPFTDDALIEASGEALDEQKSSGHYQIASAEHSGLKNDTEKTPQASSYKAEGLTQVFRDKLFDRESKGSGGYKAKNIDKKGGFALGRYQMRKPALQDAGMIDSDGNWTGKYGVNSMDDFLNNPEAQEKAFGTFMKATERYVKNTGAFKSIGEEVDGVIQKFKITKSGLMSAAHRQGHKWVAKYLKFQKENGWKSDFSMLDKDTQTYFKRVEKSLRTFENVPYEE